MLTFFKLKYRYHSDMSFHSLGASYHKISRNIFYKAEVKILGKSGRNLHSSAVTVNGDSEPI